MAETITISSAGYRGYRTNMGILYIPLLMTDQELSVDTVYDIDFTNAVDIYMWTSLLAEYTTDGIVFPSVEDSIILTNGSTITFTRADSYTTVEFIEPNGDSSATRYYLDTKKPRLYFSPYSIIDSTGFIFNVSLVRSTTGSWTDETLLTTSEIGAMSITFSAEDLVISGQLQTSRFWNLFFNGAEQYNPDEGDTEDPYSPGGVSYGTGSFGGDTIGIPSLPSLSAIDTGIFSLYAPTTAQMQALADYLWTDIDFTTDDVATVLSEIGEALKRLVANPLELMLGLSIVPSQGLETSGTSEVKVGFWSTGVSLTKLSSQYYAVDCGSLSFDTVCGGTFLDYAPYSKFSIYLPYIGTKVVDANDFVGHTIGVVYHCDVVTGGCTAYVTKDGSTMYQYSGSVALNLPLSSESWGQTFAAAVDLAGQITTGVATGGAAGAASGALQSAANIAANPSQLSPQIQHSGAVAGGAGLLGVQVPYVIREAVRFPDTSEMNGITGYPSHYVRTLSDCSGYTEIMDIHLDGISATSEEITEIENLLKSGVII